MEIKAKNLKQISNKIEEIKKEIVELYNLEYNTLIPILNLFITRVNEITYRPSVLILEVTKETKNILDILCDNLEFKNDLNYIYRINDIVFRIKLID